MGLTVTPAYRVAAKFAREARGMPLGEGVDYLERNLRAYVHQQLSSLQAILPELGERSAVAQLGDPEVEALAKSLETLEEGAPKDLVEEALALSTAALPRPDLNARILLLPGDGESRVLVQQMKGVLGISFGSQVMVIFLWPAVGWQEWLGYTVAHEYTHLVRNHLLPRGPVGGEARIREDPGARDSPGCDDCRRSGRCLCKQPVPPPDTGLDPSSQPVYGGRGLAQGPSATGHQRPHGNSPHPLRRQRPDSPVDGIHHRLPDSEGLPSQAPIEHARQPG